MRLGLLSYINSLPVTFGMESGATGFQGELVSAQPSVLNQMTEEGGLDVTPVSSIQWLRCSRDYRVVPGLGICSFGPVQSVKLFSRVPISELGDEEVAVTGASATSLMLLRILMPRLRQVRMTLQPTAYEEARDAVDRNEICFPEGYRAVLWIGDRALQFGKHNTEWVDSLDLGTGWRDLTGLPFVYAVWLCRRELPLEQVRVDLERSLSWGEAHRAAVLFEAQRRLPLPDAEMDEYYRGLNYRVGKAELEGLLEFYRRAALTGEVAPLGAELEAELRQGNSLSLR